MKNDNHNPEERSTNQMESLITANEWSSKPSTFIKHCKVCTKWVQKMNEVYVELQRISCNPSCVCIYCLFASNQNMCTVIGLGHLCRAFLFKTKTLNIFKNEWANCAKRNETDVQDILIDHFKGKDFTVCLKITAQLSRMLPLVGSQLIDVMIDSSVHLWSCYNDHRDSKSMKGFFKAFNLVEKLTV